MAFFNNEYVRTGDVILTWDGLTKPEQKNTDKGPVTVYSVRVAMPNNAPEIAELSQIANTALQEGEFRGQLPEGGLWPLPTGDKPRVASVEKLGPLVANHIMLGASKNNNVPDVYDAQGNLLAPMQYNSMLYPGCRVQLLVHAHDYNNINKGVSFFLDGVMIVDATAPRLDVGGGLSSSQVGSAFVAAAGPAPSVPGGPAPGGPAPGGPAPNMPSVTGPGAPPPAAPAAPAAAPQLVMTAMANGMTADQFRANGWTDQQLVDNGYATYNPS